MKTKTSWESLELFSLHATVHKQLPAGNVQDTCVIDQVRIGVDAFGKRDGKEMY